MRSAICSTCGRRPMASTMKSTPGAGSPPGAGATYASASPSGRSRVTVGTTTRLAPGSELGLHPGEELTCHHDPLDLVGALVDLGDLRVAHHPLDRVVAGEAVAAEHLHGVDGH